MGPNCFSCSLSATFAGPASTLTGAVAGEVGGAWAPFLIAFVVATITAFLSRTGDTLSAGGGRGPLQHRAFGVHFLAFLVAFTVSARHNLGVHGVQRLRRLPERRPRPWLRGRPRRHSVLALGFIALVAIVNFRGVGESVKASIVLTCVELSGLLMIIFIGILCDEPGSRRFYRGRGLPLVGREERFPVRDRGHRTRLLRHGRLRGFGQHGGGMRNRCAISRA